MTRNELGLIFLRIILGLIFFIHGYSKFQGGIDNTVGYFEGLGIPGFMAYMVASIELVGGLAVILGMGTRIISILFAFIMVGAIFTAKLPDEFFGYEFDLALLAMSLCLASANRTRFSLGYRLFKNKEGGVTVE
ncbi:MAG: DoxX family protein [Peribacillus sp.]